MTSSVSPHARIKGRWPPGNPSMLGHHGPGLPGLSAKPAATRGSTPPTGVVKVATGQRETATRKVPGGLWRFDYAAESWPGRPAGAPRIGFRWRCSPARHWRHRKQLLVLSPDVTFREGSAGYVRMWASKPGSPGSISGAESSLKRGLQGKRAESQGWAGRIQPGKLVKTGGARRA